MSTCKSPREVSGSLWSRPGYIPGLRRGLWPLCRWQWTAGQRM